MYERLEGQRKSTAVNLPAELYKRAKVFAAELGMRGMTEMIEISLVEYLTKYGTNEKSPCFKHRLPMTLPKDRKLSAVNLPVKLWRTANIRSAILDLRGLTEVIEEAVVEFLIVHDTEEIAGYYDGYINMDSRQNK